VKIDSYSHPTESNKQNQQQMNSILRTHSNVKVSGVARWCQYRTLFFSILASLFFWLKQHSQMAGFEKIKSNYGLFQFSTQALIVVQSRRNFLLTTKLSHFFATK